MKWMIVIDIAPKVIEGTNGCHTYVFDYCKTKREATRVTEEINAVGSFGMAFVERRKA